MELVNEFTVSSAPDSAFATLSDLERIAPCMPGALLDEIRGEDYLGRVRIRIGPVGLTFAATATILEKDLTKRRLVLRGVGKDRSGGGGAEALITMTVEDGGAESSGGEPSSRVRVVTELGLSGKVGQFGGAAIEKVSSRLIDEFVDRVNALVRGEDVSALAPAAPLASWRDLVVTTADHRAVVRVLATTAAGILLGAAIARALRSERVRKYGLQLDR